MEKNTYTFLLVANDQDSGNTDTIMLLTYDTGNQTARLISLPRDTMIDGVKDSDISRFYRLSGKPTTPTQTPTYSPLTRNPDRTEALTHLCQGSLYKENHSLGK